MHQAVSVIIHASGQLLKGRLCKKQATGLALPGADLDVVILGTVSELSRPGTGFSSAARETIASLLVSPCLNRLSFFLSSLLQVEERRYIQSTVARSMGQLCSNHVGSRLLCVYLCLCVTGYDICPRYSLQQAAPI